MVFYVYLPLGKSLVREAFKASKERGTKGVRLINNLPLNVL
ncbi:hypothetical protein ES703_15048 [subsurface metagenome]